jgi:predicted AAA+ superfamily ATPase
MPVKLTTTIKKIASIPNSINSTLLSEFCQYMKSNGASESHQNNNLKALISFAHFLGINVTFYDIKQNDMITYF